MCVLQGQGHFHYVVDVSLDITDSTVASVV